MKAPGASAGAGAVAEICAVGCPSLLIPYPYADDHQKDNALSLERAGAAVCLLAKAATPERIAAELERLTKEPDTLPRMAAAARALGRPDAAFTIAADFLALAGITPSSRGSFGETPGKDGSGGLLAAAPRTGGPHRV